MVILAIIGKYMVDKNHLPECVVTDYACTLLARDWKGVNNYGFNLVVVKQYKKNRSKYVSEKL